MGLGDLMNLGGIGGGKRVGLALRPKSIEVIEATRDGLTQLIRVPLEGGEDSDALTAMQAAIERASLSTRRMAVSIPSQDILLRFFSLPLLPRGEWEAAIKFEARKHIPFRTDELIWDYHAVQDRDRKQIGVVFAAVKKDRFERFCALLSKAGVEPTVVEPQNVSLARAAASVYPELKDEFIGVVELNNETRTAHIAVVKGSLPYLARDVSLGPKADRSQLLASNEQAESREAPSGTDENVWVAGASSPEPMPETAAPEVSPDEQGERLLSELRLSLDFFTREYPSATISRLLLYGGGEAVQSWCQVLSEQLHCPVEIGRMPMAAADHTSFEVIPTASAVGMILPSVGSARLDFLTRSSGRASTATDDIMAQLVAVLQRGLELFHSVPILDFVRSLAKPLATQAVIAAVALLVLSQVSQRQVYRAELELAEAQESQQASDRFKDFNGDALAGTQKRVDDRLAMLRRLFDERVSVTEKLESLAVSLPEGFWLESLHYRNHLQKGMQSEASLSLEGACYLAGRTEEELLVIGEFSAQIKQNPKFFHGFVTSELTGIDSAQDAGTQLAYRTFRLMCGSKEL